MVFPTVQFAVFFPIVLALDPDKRQVRAVTSNVGHCIACGVVSGS